MRSVTPARWSLGANTTGGIIGTARRGHLGLGDEAPWRSGAGPGRDLRPTLPRPWWSVEWQWLLGLAHPARRIGQTDPGHVVAFDLQDEAPVA